MEIVDIMKLREKMDGSKKPNAVVLVFSNGCGHCISMMPEWKRLEKQVKEDASLKTNPRCYLSKVESHNASMIPEIHPESIRGVPTIKFLKHGELSGDFEESGKSRNAEDMLEWIRSKIKDDNVKMHIMESPSSSVHHTNSKSISSKEVHDGDDDDIVSPYDVVKRFSMKAQEEQDNNVKVNRKPRTRRRRSGPNRKGKNLNKNPDKTNRKPRKPNRKPKGRQTGGWILGSISRSLTGSKGSKKIKRKGKRRKSK